MLSRKPKNSGFTLIEMIVTLILVGITSVLAGMWIVSVAEGYLFARMNAETLQKAQLAMARLTKEFSAIQAVTSATASQITYQRPDSSLSGTTTVTVSFSNGSLQIDNSLLTDRVNSFTLSYCDDNYPSPTCSTSWNSASRVIGISLVLSGADNTPSTFTKRVTPRNLY